VQETFMRYWREAGGVERTREWLLRVARNLSLDKLRFAGKWVAEQEDSCLELPDERDPAWHYQRHELKARLDTLIDRLPEPQRSLIVLFDVQGLKGDACARILGISTNQVKVYLHRARRRLRLELERYER
jgi:RNA polymerase sigma-70 factor (ECF subfamily)